MLQALRSMLPVLRRRLPVLQRRLPVLQRRLPVLRRMLSLEQRYKWLATTGTSTALASKQTQLLEQWRLSERLRRLLEPQRTLAPHMLELRHKLLALRK
jgi:hypothetical protein